MLKIRRLTTWSLINSCLAVCLLSGCVKDNVQYNGNIRGRVVDRSTKEPVENALVFLARYEFDIYDYWLNSYYDDSWNQVVPLAETDSNGEYLIRNYNAYPEEYIITIIKPGDYRIYDSAVFVLGNQTISVNHQLIQSDISIEIEPDSIVLDHDEFKKTYTIKNLTNKGIEWMHLSYSDYITPYQIFGQVNSSDSSEVTISIDRIYLRQNYDTVPLLTNSVFLGIFDTGELKPIRVHIRQEVE